MFLLCLRPRPQSHRNVNCNILLAVKFPGRCAVSSNILFAVKFPAAPGVGLAAGGGLAETLQATVGFPGVAP